MLQSQQIKTYNVVMVGRGIYPSSYCCSPVGATFRQVFDRFESGGNHHDW